MAKKEKKEKGFMESVHDGYIRGSMGGEEDTSQARTVTSPVSYTHLLFPAVQEEYQ